MNLEQDKPIQYPYFTEVEGIPTFHIAEWFDVVCRQPVVRDHEFDAFYHFIGEGTQSDVSNRRLERLDSISKKDTHLRKLSVIEEAVSLVVSRPDMDTEAKLNILINFSESMYNASWPMNGKRVILRHVNSYWANAHSATSFNHAPDEVYERADDLQWRARKEIPRLKTRRQIFEEVFTLITGERMPKLFPAFMAIDAAMEAQSLQLRYEEKSKIRSEATRKANVQKIAELLKKDPTLLSEALFEQYYD